MVHWLGMKKDAKTYVRECDVCQKNKYLIQKPVGVLQPLHILEQVWKDVSMNFIGFPTSHGKSNMLVIVDKLFKYSHFISLSHPFIAKWLLWQRLWTAKDYHFRQGHYIHKFTLERIYEYAEHQVKYDYIISPTK